MKALTKYLAGAAAAAAVTVSAASPAQAQIFGRDPYGRNSGVNVGDIISGVAVLGGIGAIVAALGRDGGRYGYGNRDRYQNDYRNAVNACASEAQRYGRGGQVNITDVERQGYDSYRVRGVIDASYNEGRYGRYDNRYGSRYDNRYGSQYDPRYSSQYDPRYGSQYDPRYGSQYDTRYGSQYDPRYGSQYDTRYGRNDAYGRSDQRVGFACTARSDGRVRDFDRL